MKRTTWITLLGLALLISTMVFGERAYARSEESPTAAEVAASFDVKYFNPDYIAYSGIAKIARHALAVREAAQFDAKYLDPAHIVRGASGFSYAAADEAQAFRWLAMAHYYEQLTALDAEAVLVSSTP